MRSEDESEYVHRGAYELSIRATELYEQARVRVARFINAGRADEVIFTRSTTEAINLVAYAWGRANLGPGDAIVVTEMGRFDRGLESDPAGGSKYRVIWWPQRDETPNGVPAEFVIKL